MAQLSRSITPGVAGQKRPCWQRGVHYCEGVRYGDTMFYCVVLLLLMKTPAVAMCRTEVPQQTLQPVPTERDIWCFRLFRTAVGVVVLGLTGLFAVLTTAPLLIEGLAPGPPAPPPTPAAPFTLWSEHDAHASHMILIISSVQAMLLCSCWLLCRRPGGARPPAVPTDHERRRLKANRGARRASAASKGSKAAPAAEPMLGNEGAPKLGTT